MMWPLIKFGELYKIPSLNGLTRPIKVRGRGFRMVNMGELFAYERIGDVNMERVPLNERELEKFTLEPGDLLFARQSLILEGAGKCSIILPQPEPTCFESHIIRVRLDPKKAEPFFYYYLFKTRYSGISTIVQQCAQAGIRSSELAELEMLYPPLDVQHYIAEILTTYDELLENNCRRMELLEELARQLYREWFISLRFPGHEQTRIEEGVPEGWMRSVLGDICLDIREPVNPSQIDPDTPYIGLEHIPRRSISLSKWGFASDVTSTKHRFCAGEILFGKIRPYFHKVGIAFIDGITSSDAIVIRAISEELSNLVLMTVSSDAFVAQASQTMREGSKMPRADWKIMRQYPVVLAPKGLLEDFNKVIAPIIEQLKVLTLNNQKLQSARDLILNKLISGGVTV